MKKLLLAAFLALAPASAWAQCTGIFQPNTYCGNNTGTPQPPFQISGSTSITGPGSSTVGDLALWNNTLGTSLKDQAPGALTTSNDTNITLTPTGLSSIALVNAAGLTAGWQGTLAASRLNSNVVQSVVNDTNVTGSISGQALTLGWTGTLAAARLNSNVVQSVVNDTNVTGSISGQSLTLGWTGTLSVARGGTGSGTQSGAAINLLPTPVNPGDIIYWNGSTWTTLAGNTSGTQLLQENSSGLPSWVTVTGTGTVTNVATNGGVTGGPITTTGTISSDPNYQGWATQNCTLSTAFNTPSAGLLTVSLKDNAGSTPTAASPCNINYRNSTLSTGSTVSVQQTTGLSISTFATGASLGTQNSKAFRLWVLSLYNAGTNVLALFNANGADTIFPLNEGQNLSSTAISGSANLSGIAYTPNGTTLNNVPFRILGYIEYPSTGLGTAGTYNAGPSIIQAFGPGIHKPGEEIQSTISTTTTAGTTASATFAALTSGQSKNFTPTSAANLVEVIFFGTASASANASYSLQAIRNGATTIGQPQNFSVSTGGNTNQNVGDFFDQPNATTQQTYSFQGKTGGGTLSYPVGSSGAYLKLIEKQS